MNEVNRGRIVSPARLLHLGTATLDVGGGAISYIQRRTNQLASSTTADKHGKQFDKNAELYKNQPVEKDHSHMKMRKTKFK